MKKTKKKSSKGQVVKFPPPPKKATDKKSPKGGVVTKPNGDQFVEEALSQEEFEAKASKTAQLIEDKGKLRLDEALMKAEHKELRLQIKEKMSAIDEQLASLGYEVKHKIKKVPRQQTLKFDPEAKKPEPEITNKV